MKTRFLKATTVVVMICMLTFSMTGCKALDYRDAIDLYNSGDYVQAAEMFAQLDDFEDSQRLETLCRYWIAIGTMEAGEYETAISLLEAMNGYDDTAERITECKYQLALHSFEQGDLADAESYFLQLPEYRQTPEYLRQITWQKFFDAVAEAPLSAEAEGKVYSLTANAADNTLVFYAGSQTDNGFTFHNDLTLTVSRDSLIADFVATDAFSMPFHTDAIGAEQSIFGRVDISTCTAETIPLMESFEKTVQDNQGNTTTSTDPADAAVTEALMENFKALMTVIPELIEKAGFSLTLHDIGFSAM